MMSDNDVVILRVSGTANDEGEKLINFEYNSIVQKSRSTNNPGRSVIFSPSCSKQLKFYLTTTDREDLAAYSLCLLPCEMPELTINYKVSWHGGQVEIASLSVKGVPSSEQITEYKLITGDIGQKIGRCGVSRLQIRCKIELSIDDESHTLQPTLWNEICLYPGVSLPKSELVENLRQLFETCQLSDVIINVGGASVAEEFSAHKAILSMRSPVFSAMFEHGMLEKQENRVDVTDMEPEVFQELLRFIYTDASPGVKKMADKLLAAAERYQLRRLKAMCEDALSKNLTIENAVDTFTCADLYRADNLKKWTISFINVHIKKIIATPGFQSTIHSHPHLTAEILSAWAGE